jgi:polyphosphate kinase 2 (PPK2 family)
MKINIGKFRIPARKKVDLRQWPTEVKPFYESEKDYRDSQAAGLDDLTGLQKKLYASGKYALLVIFQAMDAAGKDSAIKHVMSGVDPQGCQVFSFKKPSEEELKHDFLWRSNCRLPERGRIGIFNRSYYEEVLVVKVHPEYLRAQGIDPDRIVR